MSLQTSALATEAKAHSLLEQLRWRDPLSGQPLHVHVVARDFVGRPYVGALIMQDGRSAYPIVGGIPRLTPALALRHARWLETMGLRPAHEDRDSGAMQSEESIASFGFQWQWDNEPRTEEDLRWRVHDRHGLSEDIIAAQDVLDAGSGAGDQSRYLVRQGAATVVSVDLSDAIEVAARKLEGHSNWLGVQGDIGRLPFDTSTFSLVYCEGVIQHTEDSARTVQELTRVLRMHGVGIATHYSTPRRMRQRIQHKIRNRIRRTLSKRSTETILLVSGIVAAGTRIPLVGRLWGKTVAVTNPRMTSLRATWSCTYDTYGHHSFQRYMDTERFQRLFDLPGVSHRLSPDGGVLFERHEPVPDM